MVSDQFNIRSIRCSYSSSWSARHGLVFQRVPCDRIWSLRLAWLGAQWPVAGHGRRGELNNFGDLFR